MFEKLASGVLQIATPLGPRFLRLTFWQRLCFLWLFRHFPQLPQQVLATWQRRLVDDLCVRQQFVIFPRGHADAPVIGIIERRPPQMTSEPVPAGGKPVHSSVPPLAQDLRRSS
jgi:hypothetical protein